MQPRQTTVNHMAKPTPAFPEFLIIGAPQAGGDTLKLVLQKAANVWFPPLDNLLIYHPSFNVSRVLTLRKLYKKEMAYKKRDIGWLLRFFLRISPSTKWYMSLFQTKEEGLLKGELSDEYISLPYDAVEKLRHTMPDLKIILMIRNPINRTYSSIRHYFAKDPKTPFAKMTKRQIVAAMNSPSARNQSGFNKALDNWGTFFPARQIFLGYYEDMLNDPYSFYTKLYAFLDLPPETPILDIVPPAEPAFPEGLYKHLSPFYREEMEALIARVGGAARTWTLPSAPEAAATAPVSKRSHIRTRIPKPAPDAAPAPEPEQSSK